MIVVARKLWRNGKPHDEGGLLCVVLGWSVVRGGHSSITEDGSSWANLMSADGLIWTCHPGNMTIVSAPEMKELEEYRQMVLDFPDG